MKLITRKCAALLALILLLSVPVLATQPSVQAVAEDTAAAMIAAQPSLGFGSTGGEWAALALARGGFELPEGYLERYLAAVTSHVKASGGVLHTRKHTEYARAVLALTAIGADPTAIAGYDLTAPLGDYEQTIWQGINGAVWALTALDSGGYPVPENPQAKTQATRQLYVDFILAQQLPSGGWSLSSQAADADLTAMALQALSSYSNQAAVAAAIESGLGCLSGLQRADGSFASYGTNNAESCAHVIIALCSLDIDLSDNRFVKDDSTVLDSLLAFYRPGAGFAHIPEGEVNVMATEQALMALVAVLRAESGQRGQSGLYAMAEAEGHASNERHPDIKLQAVTLPGKTFSDISGTSRTAIEALACRGVITGMDADRFVPDDTMTRAQFSAIIVRGLGLPLCEASGFADVPESHWAAGYVGAASAYGIVTGRSESVFDPSDLITVEEAAVIVARAAALCGLDTSIYADSAPDGTSAWAQGGMAFCLETGILEAALAQYPKQAILREQVAQMVFNLLDTSGLLGA